MVKAVDSQELFFLSAATLPSAPTPTPRAAFLKPLRIPIMTPRFFLSAGSRRRFFLRCCAIGRLCRRSGGGELLDQRAQAREAGGGPRPVPEQVLAGGEPDRAAARGRQVEGGELAGVIRAERVRLVRQEHEVGGAGDHLVAGDPRIAAVAAGRAVGGDRRA